jgi:hypothetical protein
MGKLLFAGGGEALGPVAWPLVVAKSVDKSSEVDLRGDVEG